MILYFLINYDLISALLCVPKALWNKLNFPTPSLYELENEEGELSIAWYKGLGPLSGEGWSGPAILTKVRHDQALYGKNQRF